MNHMTTMSAANSRQNTRAIFHLQVIQVTSATEVELVVSLSCSGRLDRQARLGEAAVDEAAAVLDVPQAAADALDEVFGGGEGDVGQPSTPQQGPDLFDGVEVGCVGRQVVDGQPLAGCRPLPQVGGFVDVQVVPGEDDRAAESPEGPTPSWCAAMSRSR
jgi:hypothetical protein